MSITDLLTLCLATIWTVVSVAGSFYAIRTWRRRITDFRYEVHDLGATSIPANRLVGVFRVRLARRRVQTSLRQAFTLAIFGLIGLTRYVAILVPFAMDALRIAISLGLIIILASLVAGILEEEHTDEFLSRPSGEIGDKP